MTKVIGTTRKGGGTARILVVAHDAMLYGAQRSLLEIMGEIARDRLESHVVIPSSGPFTDALQELGIAFHYGLVQRWIYFPRPMTWRQILRRPWRRLNHPYVWTLLSLLGLPLRLALLWLLVRIRRIDLIYTNTATVLDGALVARICGIPHVWHIRERVIGNRDLASPFSLHWFPEFVTEYSTRVIVNSRFLGRAVFGDEMPDKVMVIPNGVDLCHSPAGALPQSLPALPAGARLAAVCGVIQEQKDISTYLKMAARLRNSHPCLHHLVIGKCSPGYRKRLEREILDLGLEQHIHFLGYRNDIPTIFSAIDVLLSTSLFESFGRTLIEAMAAGKPVIATRSGGPQEIIEEGISGYLVDIGDDDALASRLALLLDEPARYHAMCVAAQKRAKDFDLCRTSARIEEVILAAAGWRIATSDVESRT